MKLWQSLYSMVWLCLFTLIAATLDVIPYKAPVHAALGLAVLGLAFRNKAALAKSQAPARLKRISTATASISVMAAVTGALMAVPPLHFLDVLWRVLHLCTIVAISTQAGSVATAYDMWEEKEFAPPA